MATDERNPIISFKDADIVNGEATVIYGLDMDGTTIYETDLKGNVAVVVGSEGDGMRKSVSENCDFILSIPMYGKINSLNASVAAGIFIYEVVRQRG